MIFGFMHINSHKKIATYFKINIILRRIVIMGIHSNKYKNCYEQLFETLHKELTFHKLRLNNA